MPTRSTAAAPSSTAGRLWAKIGEAEARWSGSVSGSLLGSSNRNLLDDDPVNRTRASRATLGGQLEHRLTTGTVEHLLIAAVDLEREKFHARDTAFGGASPQDRSRRHDAITLEWRADFADRVVTDVAVRRDRFDRFKDATTLRASALARVSGEIDFGAVLWRGYRPADLLRPVRLLSRMFRRQSRRSSRKARADLKCRCASAARPGARA